MKEFKHVYCLFCETGKEEIARILCEKLLNVRAIQLSAEKLRYFRGKQYKQLARVLPSYLFVYFFDDIEAYKFTRIDHVFRALSLSGEYELHDEDLRFAQWVYRTGGLMKTSQAYREGDHIAVLEGPLKDYEDDIVWVDKRKGKAKVHIVTENLDVGLWLYFEYAQNQEQELATV
jgi:transcription termination/antitermination protein NusG